MDAAVAPGAGTRWETPGTTFLCIRCWLKAMVVYTLKMLAPRHITAMLLHVASHVAVEHDPDEERAVDLLNVLQRGRVGHFNLDAEILLFDLA